MMMTKMKKKTGSWFWTWSILGSRARFWKKRVGTRGGPSWRQPVYNYQDYMHLHFFWSFLYRFITTTLPFLHVSIFSCLRNPNFKSLHGEKHDPYTLLLIQSLPCSLSILDFLSNFLKIMDIWYILIAFNIYIYSWFNVFYPYCLKRQVGANHWGLPKLEGCNRNVFEEGTTQLFIMKEEDKYCKVRVLDKNACRIITYGSMKKGSFSHPWNRKCAKCFTWEVSSKFPKNEWPSIG